jgi:hypothetical protein
MPKEALVAQSVVMLVWVGMVVWQRYHRTLKKGWQAWRGKPKRAWTLRDRAPNDCQDCRLAEAEAGPRRSQARRPWSEVKSRRGRPKTHDSSGQACMNPRCEYYQDTDPDFHALGGMDSGTPVKRSINGNAEHVSANIQRDWARRCIGSRQPVSG